MWFKGGFIGWWEKNKYGTHGIGRYTVRGLFLSYLSFERNRGIRGTNLDDGAALVSRVQCYNSLVSLSISPSLFFIFYFLQTVRIGGPRSLWRKRSSSCSLLGFKPRGTKTENPLGYTRGATITSSNQIICIYPPRMRRIL